MLVLDIFPGGRQIDLWPSCVRAFLPGCSRFPRRPRRPCQRCLRCSCWEIVDERSSAFDGREVEPQLQVAQIASCKQFGDM